MSPPAGPLSIAYVTVGLYSYLHRTFPIARLAAARGHRFTVITDHRPAIEYTRAQGIAAVLLERQEAAWAATLPAPHWPRGNRVIGRIPGIGLGPRADVRRTYRARRAAMLDTGELLETIDGLDADLVVTELEQHRDIRAVLGAELPLAIVDDHYGTRPGAGTPHPGSTLVPTGSPLSRVRARLGWEWLFWRQQLTDRAERWWLDGADPRSVLAELADREGIGADSIGTRTAVFHDYRDVPTVRPLAEELFFPGDDRSGIITGPIVDEERNDPLVDEGFAGRWSEIVDRRRSGAERRLVLLAFGTMLRDQHRLVEAAVASLGESCDLDVVLAVGRDIEHWERRQLPDNVHLFGRVPQLAVLAEADAMIGAGGPATVHEALWHGVPQVLVSGRGVAQEGLVARTVAAGLGRRIHPRRVSADRIRTEVDRVLADDEMRARVQELGARIRARHGTARTLDALESVAA